MVEVEREYIKSFSNINDLHVKQSKQLYHVITAAILFIQSKQ